MNRFLDALYANNDRIEFTLRKEFVNDVAKLVLAADVFTYENATKGVTPFAIM